MVTSGCEWFLQLYFTNPLEDDYPIVAPNKNEPAFTAQFLDSTIKIDISMEQARSTPWPFPPHKGESMGLLVDAKQIALKDLGYAIENAWDDRVRRAAMALLLLLIGYCRSPC